MMFIFKIIIIYHCIVPSLPLLSRPQAPSPRYVVPNDLIRFFQKLTIIIFDFFLTSCTVAIADCCVVSNRQTLFEYVIMILKRYRNIVRIEYRSPLLRRFKFDYLKNQKKSFLLTKHDAKLRRIVTYQVELISKSIQNFRKYRNIKTNLVSKDRVSSDMR